MPPVLDQLRVRVAASLEIPDPANIQTTGDWYVLDHLSSGLAAFDSKAKRFVPRLAEGWSQSADGAHVFMLRSGVTFHDGTPITAKDVVWSIKRLLLLKTSTHFPLWEYVLGCEHLRSLDDECEGLRATSRTAIVIRLKTKADSFFLQLASPETGIWSAQDMDPRTGKLTPTRFSGPYFSAGKQGADLLLERNDRSPVIAEFPQAPLSLLFRSIGLRAVDQALADGQVDLVVRSHRPMGEQDWRTKAISVRASAPSTVIYLQGTGVDPSKRPAMGRNLIESAWETVRDPKVTPAGTFLPFAGSHGLSHEEFLEQLPKGAAATARVVVPEGFFSETFLDSLRKAGQAVGTALQFVATGSDEYFAAFDDPKAAEKYDYILASYAASERYPAVQLRYIAGSLAHAPIDLKAAESPDLTSDQVKILRKYQQWLLSSRQAIPLFFISTLILSRSDLDIGDQPDTDAEVELWRVKRRIP